MSPYYRHRRSYGQGTNGRQRALQHIEEARQLTAELGGADEDVKRYFFSLSGGQLKNVLDEYERIYDPDRRRGRREYAEQTIPKWKSGRVKMSGMVASRLFDLLPPRMPLQTKYDLVETVWKRHCPQSSRTFHFGSEVQEAEVMCQVIEHLENTIKSYRVPEPLERRFRWLAHGDVLVYERLLNHFQMREVQSVIDQTRRELPILIRTVQTNGNLITAHVRKHIKVGHHELELHFGSEQMNSYALKWFLAALVILGLLLLAMYAAQ